MKIAVLVSGGVDSSVALHRLHAEGHQVEAFYLKIWLEDELAYLGNCPWQEDLRFVEHVCQSLNVPLHIIPLQQEYWERVVRATLTEIRAGRTPSPDILCNQRIKFGAFFDAIDDSFDKIATGHYAQIRYEHDLFWLTQAHDSFKDQTYFLSQISQQQLARLMFPIGHLTKPEVRSYAQAVNLLNKDRKDSQGICFLGKINFQDFVRHYHGSAQGDLVEFETSKVVGTHDGFWFYTIGQRKGIGLSGGPWYVVSKDPAANRVFVSKHYYDDHHARNQCFVYACNWISRAPAPSFNCTVKLRHGEKLIPAEISSHQDQLLVKLAERDQGIAPGQFVVFYQDDICLGSGIIAEQGTHYD